jgi:hypothetical protein
VKFYIYCVNFSPHRLINPTAANSTVETTGGNKTGEDPDPLFDCKENNEKWNIL